MMNSSNSSTKNSSHNDVQNDTREFSSACREMQASFFDRFRDEAFQSIALRALEQVVSQYHHFDGKPGGWAGGLIHAIAKNTGLGRHVVLNSELEAIFGVSIGTIRRRAEQVWPIIEAEVTRLLPGNEQRGAFDGEFTLRDEANAICAYAFRNGPIEDIHASVDSDRHPRITDPEMKCLMIDASSKLTKLLEMKAADPEGYLAFVKDYHRMYCRRWDR
jgi:hypothetical protein